MNFCQVRGENPGPGSARRFFKPRPRDGCLRRFASPYKEFAQQRPGLAKCAGMRRGKERSD
jgi:hypothetical protein